MRKSIFEFKKLSLIDYLIITGYTLISLIIFLIYVHDKEITNSDFRILFFYGFLTQFLIYQFLYRFIRNFSHFIFWIIVGFFHLYLYFVIKDLPLNPTALINVKVFRNTLLILGLFQIFRLISFNIKGLEFVAPAGNTRWDLYDERKLNILDVIFYFLFWGAMVGLLFI